MATTPTTDDPSQTESPIEMNAERREVAQPVMDVDGTGLELRFQLATNGIVCITAAADEPIILTSAGTFN